MHFRVTLCNSLVDLHKHSDILGDSLLQLPFLHSLLFAIISLEPRHFPQPLSASPPRSSPAPCHHYDPLVVGILASEEVIMYVCAEHDACPFLRGDFVALVAPLLICLYLLPKVFPLLGGPAAGLDA